MLKAFTNISINKLTFFIKKVIRIWKVHI